MQLMHTIHAIGRIRKLILLFAHEESMITLLLLGIMCYVTLTSIGQFSNGDQVWKIDAQERVSLLSSLW